MMKSAKTKLTGFVLAMVFSLVYPSVSWASLPVLFEDDFDDGNYNGWSPTNYAGDPATPPDVVASPQGYSLRGIGSGYTQDPGLSVCLVQALSITNIGELEIAMRAKSGAEWPNQVSVTLCSGNDHYTVRDYGEANHRAEWEIDIGGVEEERYEHDIGNMAYEWHDFAWRRDAAGWWSLSIDWVVQAADFYQDNQLTSFDQIQIHILRNQSELEWIRISGIPEPATLGLVVIGGLALLRRRRGAESVACSYFAVAATENGSQSSKQSRLSSG